MVKRGRVAIIPARGGSKRLPRKNIIDFFGRPLIGWTIAAANESGLFDRVIVSTDSAEIADIARAQGAEVPFLRDGLADDFTPISAVTVGALDQIADTLGEQYETVVQLMANCPLRDASHVKTSIAAFDHLGATFQISCVRFGWLNPWWAVRRNEDGSALPLFPDAFGKRSQDLDPLFSPTGAIWIARSAALRQYKTFYGPRHRYEPLPWSAGVDIDEEDDLAFARAAYFVSRERL
jgi:N-acylneuraminate cytidylyltransferase